SNEGFLRDGKTYAWWGIWPALFRLFFLPFLDLPNTDITTFSCLVAACLGGYLKVRAVVALYLHSEQSPIRRPLFWALILSIVLGGAQVQFLHASIYQEVMLWGGAFASAFVYCAIRGLVIHRKFSSGLLMTMAVVAGLGLLTRVTVGLGLYISLGLL